MHTMAFVANHVTGCSILVRFMIRLWASIGVTCSYSSHQFLTCIYPHFQGRSCQCQTKDHATVGKRHWLYPILDAHSQWQSSPMLRLSGLHKTSQPCRRKRTGTQCTTTPWERGTERKGGRRTQGEHRLSGFCKNPLHLFIGT